MRQEPLTERAAFDSLGRWMEGVPARVAQAEQLAASPFNGREAEVQLTAVQKGIQMMREAWESRILFDRVIPPSGGPATKTEYVDFPLFGFFSSFEGKEGPVTSGVAMEGNALISVTRLGRWGGAIGLGECRRSMGDYSDRVIGSYAIERGMLPGQACGLWIGNHQPEGAQAIDGTDLWYKWVQGAWPILKMR